MLCCQVWLRRFTGPWCRGERQRLWSWANRDARGGRALRRRTRNGHTRRRWLRRSRAVAAGWRLTMIRVLIADDRELVRTGFRVILSAESDIEVVGEASDGSDTIKSASA